MILVNGASVGGELAIFKEVISRMQVKIQTDQIRLVYDSARRNLMWWESAIFMEEFLAS